MDQPMALSYMTGVITLDVDMPVYNKTSSCVIFFPLKGRGKREVEREGRKVLEEERGDGRHMSTIWKTWGTIAEVKFELSYFIVHCFVGINQLIFLLP